MASTSNYAQSKRKKNKKDKSEISKPPEKKKEGKIKPYNEVITKSAISDDGLFKTHQVGESYFLKFLWNT
ncbi:hypothetical protein JCM19274_5439 [Algibacter lectus]|uniref:DUF5118 domain-containing protein n=1 Tax=Algibacter lectus TaxID=221126 RepID=A0A090WL56_9FLAO|nr:hypothetical protein JCM19274_5439 [Algibacter lectus]